MDEGKGFVAGAQCCVRQCVQTGNFTRNSTIKILGVKSPVTLPCEWDEHPLMKLGETSTDISVFHTRWAGVYVCECTIQCHVISIHVMSCFDIMQSDVFQYYIIKFIVMRLN